MANIGGVLVAKKDCCILVTTAYNSGLCVSCKSYLMGLFDFFKKNKITNNKVSPNNCEEDKSKWTGRNFEFLITGDIDIPAEDYDRILTPTTFEWRKVNKEDWYYYQIGNDEFTYSWELPGIQMTFNEEITYSKAKRIADEIIDNIKATGQNAELIVLDSTKIYRFEL